MILQETTLNCIIHLKQRKNWLVKVTRKIFIPMNNHMKKHGVDLCVQRSKFYVKKNGDKVGIKCILCYHKIKKQKKDRINKTKLTRSKKNCYFQSGVNWMCLFQTKTWSVSRVFNYYENHTICQTIASILQMMCKDEIKHRIDSDM